MLPTPTPNTVQEVGKTTTYHNADSFLIQRNKPFKKKELFPPSICIYNYKKLEFI